MKIETKYNIGERLFFMQENEIRNSIVYGIHYNETSSGSGTVKEILYNMNPRGTFKEDKLFKTKEELIATL